MTFITPILSLLIALGVFFGYMYPTYHHEIAHLKQEIATYDSALGAATEYLARQNEISEEQGKISQEQMERLKAFLPDGVDNVQLILDLNALTKSAGISLSDIDVKLAKASSPSASNVPLTASGAPVASSAGRIQLKDKGPVESVDLSLSFTASYPRIVSFLSGLEQSLRPLDVTSLTIQGPEKETTNYPVDMTLRVYWLP